MTIDLPHFIAAVPLALVVAWVAAPGSVQERFVSLFKPGKADSNQHRIVSWRTGWEMIRAHPLTGLGPQEVERRFVEFIPADVPQPLPQGYYGHLHNIYLQFAAERGLLVLGAVLWLFGMALWDFSKRLRTLGPGPSDERFLLHGGIAVVLATMIAGVAEHNLGDSEVLTMFLTVLATAYTAVQDEPQALANAA